MKVVLCLLVLASVVFAEKCLIAETREKLEKIIDECRTETGVSEENLTKARNLEKIDDPKLKDHALCVMKKTKLMNDAGDLEMDTIRSRVKNAVSNEEEANKIITDCCVKKDTPLETAYASICCFMRNKDKVNN